MGRDGHYRFEFDVGPSKPELVKILWVARDRNDKVPRPQMTVLLAGLPEPSLVGMRNKLGSGRDGELD